MSPRYSIIPGAFCDDERARLMHYKVMTRIGRHTRHSGWCEISQSKLATALEVTRESINRAIRDLCSWGYLEKRSQAETGRSICYYRVIMDLGGLGAEDTDDGIGTGECDVQRHTPVTSDVTGGCDAAGHTRVTPESTLGVTSSSHTINDPKRRKERKEDHKPARNPRVAASGPAKADEPEIGELNGATTAIVQGVGRWLNNLRPDLPTARRIVASNVALYGADAVRRGFADMQADVIDGKIVGSPLKAFTGYCDQAKRGRNLNSSNGSTYATNRQGSGTRVLNKHERLKLAIAESNRQLGIGAD